MGLSVISSMPKGVSPTASSQTNALAEGLPGEFASILSGELLGAKGLVPEFSGKALAATRLEKYPQLSVAKGVNLAALPQNRQLGKEFPDKFAASLSDELLGSGISPATTRPEEFTKPLIDDAQGQTTSLSDPSILGSLTGNPALQPEITVRGSISFQVSPEKLEKGIAEFNAVTDTSLNRPAEQRSKTRDIDGLGVFEKLISTMSRTGQSDTPANDTANFAAEHTPLDTSNTALTNAIGATSATKQSHETLVTNQSSIQPHIRENSWSQQFGEKIVWLAKNDQQSARININPPELGPVQITLSLNGDQAKLAFSSPHAEVRQAIESALPQLKEMLSSAGISLGQANVGANPNHQNPDNPYLAANGKHSADENAILPANDKALSTSISTVLQRGRGLVDLFA